MIRHKQFGLVFIETPCTQMYMHWRRLVKLLVGQTKTLGGQKVIKSDKCMDESLLCGARARATP